MVVVERDVSKTRKELYKYKYIYSFMSDVVPKSIFIFFKPFKDAVSHRTSVSTGSDPSFHTNGPL